MSKMNVCNELVDERCRHRKKSSKRSPKKADHKHVFKLCVFEYPGVEVNRVHGFIPSTKVRMGSYCDICGKVGSGDDWWYRIVLYNSGVLGRFELTEEGKKQWNPDTRTLPTFHLNDPFQKAVDISSLEKAKGYAYEQEAT